MTAHFPIATRPIATLNRRAGIILSFGVLAAAGTGASSLVLSSKASAALAASGVGAFSPTMRGQASATIAMAGAGALAVTLRGNASAVVNIAGVGAAAFPGISKGLMALSSSGTGSMAAAITAIARSAMACTGAGSFSPIMRGQASATTSMQGQGQFGGSDAPGSTLNVVGYGTFTAVGYALFLDAERAGPVNEPRTAWVPVGDRFEQVDDTADANSELREVEAVSENRIAVAPAEDRVYYTHSKVDPPAPPNRRRML